MPLFYDVHIHFGGSARLQVDGGFVPHLRFVSRSEPSEFTSVQLLWNKIDIKTHHHLIQNLRVLPGMGLNFPKKKRETYSYGHLSVISTNKTPFIECIP